ncbi:MAG TPA: hypothetical protein VGC06_17250 [Actinomycetes bacterium]
MDDHALGCPPDRVNSKAEEAAVQAIYGTSHTISLAEAKHVYQKGAMRLIIGAGQSGMVALSDEAAAYVKRLDCQIDLLPTPDAIPVWNDAAGAVIGLLHVTC